MDAPYQLYGLLIALALTLVVLRERRRWKAEGIPAGLSGFRIDFHQNRGDRVAILLLVVSWLASSLVPSAPTPTTTLVRTYGFQAVEFGVIAWFALRRKEFERLQTYRASFITLGALVIFIIGKSLLADVPGWWFINLPLPQGLQSVLLSGPPSSRAVLTFAEITFLGSYLFLKRRQA